MRLMILSLTAVLSLAILAPARVNHLTRNACADHGGVIGVHDYPDTGQRGVRCHDGSWYVLGDR